MKPPIDIQITPDEFGKLSGKGRWDVIVALRGPDLQHSEIMKWFTTSVIRWAMRNVMRVGGQVNQLLPLVVLPNSFQGVVLNPTPTSWDANHFLNHVHEAAGWINIPRVYIPLDIWRAAMVPTGKGLTYPSHAFAEACKLLLTGIGEEEELKEKRAYLEAHLQQLKGGYIDV